jgi:hypothetical protein
VNIILTWTAAVKCSSDGKSWHSDTVDAGTRDARGRLCGCSASIELWKPYPGNVYSESYLAERAAAPYALQIHTHRDGRGFGAIPRRTWYATLEAAQAAASKKVAASLRSAARKAAKGVGRQWAKAGGAS